MSRVDGVTWDELLTGQREQAVRDIAALLDELPPGERTRLLKRAGPQHLQRLFEFCSAEPLRPGQLVPGNVPTVHDGVNSLPLFRVFQKRFFRTAEGQLAGYNPGPFNWAITPGYFVVRAEGEHLLFDYTELPQEVPEGWPRPIPNQSKLGRFVYYGLRDEMRRVAEHVCVGAVARHGRPIGTWFVLSRRPDT